MPFEKGKIFPILIFANSFSCFNIIIFSNWTTNYHGLKFFYSGSHPFVFHFFFASKRVAVVAHDEVVDRSILSFDHANKYVIFHRSCVWTN